MGVSDMHQRALLVRIFFFFFFFNFRSLYIEKVFCLKRYESPLHSFLSLDIRFWHLYLSQFKVFDLRRFTVRVSHRFAIFLFCSRAFIKESSRILRTFRQKKKTKQCRFRHETRSSDLSEYFSDRVLRVVNENNTPEKLLFQELRFITSPSHILARELNEV